MRLPSRSRATSLPSLTARRPNVDSAIPVCRQNSDIWLRSWSYFIAPKVGSSRGAPEWYHHLPTNETFRVPGFAGSSEHGNPRKSLAHHDVREPRQPERLLLRRARIRLSDPHRKAVFIDRKSVV